MVCASCRAGLPGDPFVAWPTPTPEGLVLPWAAGPYDGTLRRLVLGLKEQRLLSLAPVLGDLLATSAAATGGDGPLLLVPAPSSPASVRARALDSTLLITRHAARSLRRAGAEATVAPLLRTRPGVIEIGRASCRERVS
jgi:predicted amidophosphoribosyltransferase